MTLYTWTVRIVGGWLFLIIVGELFPESNTQQLTGILGALYVWIWVCKRYIK